MRIGIDLGVTRIEAVGLNDDGVVVVRRRVVTPGDDYDGTIAALVALVSEIEARTGERCTVGVGTPGATSTASGLLKNADSLWLNGRPLAEDLECAIARPVRLANDAHCFALSEAMDGAAMGAEVVFGVILGTVIGGGIVVRGRPLRGPNAVGGEWGHNPMPWPEPGEWPGPACYCGRTGCIELLLSGAGLTREYQEAGGPDRAAEAIVAAVADGDARAEAVLVHYEQRLARALAAVINVLDPDVIVLGGSLSSSTRLYANVPPLWERFVFSDRVSTRLVPPKHGDASGVRGAAWLWPKAAAVVSS
jgi:fructokinase